ncbi:helix-turn-helix domain-containing protein [Vagococcus elongatus]|uniref:Mga helix-turn-helix domain-containing protein n=1 Tax=Vagococcus elongatus TaxID=180344 RepID=A0A430AU00_9ENTE|nr:helix-turn-helix domain-containing protein [Vagococcus elongatus]RSU11526.1 hypothetical protein CBF29_07530 [Vagococcus elongatus]
MKVDQLLEKKEQLQVKILRSLILNGGSMPLNLLRAEIGLSKSGFDQYIEEINHLHVFRVRGGITVDAVKITLHLPEEVNFESILAFFLEDAIKFNILDYLLSYQEFTTVKLVTTLSLSESTLFRKIKELNGSLSEFDIQIKNGCLQGEELQVRYFYFQLYRFLIKNKANDYSFADSQNQRFIRELEKKLKTTFNESAEKKINCWLTITKKRLNNKKTNTVKLQEKMTSYLADSLYQQVSSLMQDYFSYLPTESIQAESMMFYVFLVSFSLFDEERFYEYDISRSKKLPTAMMDVFVRETILLHYRPRRLSIQLEKKVGYQVSHINSQLYFFKGKLEVYHRQNMLERQKLLLGNTLVTLLDRLLNLALDQIHQPYHSQNTLHDTTLLRYASVLSMIDFLMTKTIKVAIDFEEKASYCEPFYQLLLIELRPMIGVELELYQKNKSYDLILTTSLVEKKYSGLPQTYCLSEFYSEYDIYQVKEVLKKMRISKN